MVDRKVDHLRGKYDSTNGGQRLAARLVLAPAGFPKTEAQHGARSHRGQCANRVTHESVGNVHGFQISQNKVSQLSNSKPFPPAESNPQAALRRRGAAG